MNVLPILLLTLAGLLTGGVISLVRARATRFSIALVAALAVFAFAGGIVWLIPGER